MFAATATAAAGLSLVIALVFADVLIRDQIERELAGAAKVMAVEIDEKPAVMAMLDEEAHELGIEGRTALVPARGEQLATCEELGGSHPLEFACRHPLVADPEQDLLVAIPIARLEAHRPAMAIAGMVVLFSSALGAAWIGRLLAARSLAPLARLQQAVSDIDPSSPMAVELPGRSNFDELDALRSALASLLERLDTELTLTRRFSSAVAHELRTPLTKMLAELELAREGGGALADTERLHRTTAHLITLTERLLLLATPREALDSGHATSMALVAEALLERRSPDELQRLRIITEETDALVRGDEVLLAVMLDNVVDNALGFSTGPVVVAVCEGVDEVTITVDDEGPGVPAELAEQLFLPFRRASTARSRPGHGLGLALVAHVAQACGGRVGFVPGRPRGARIEIRLPRVASLARARDAARTHH